jgi:hypothetical protein
LKTRYPLKFQTGALRTFDALCVGQLRCLRSGDSGGRRDRPNLKPSWITLTLDKPDSAFRVSVSVA